MSSTDSDESLFSSLSLAEGQPLSERAAAYEHLYDELRTALEGGDFPARD